jgi:hypothetical protein
VNRLKRPFLIALLMSAMTVATATAQNPAPQQNDAEKLRVQYAEQARREAEQRDWEAKIFQIKYADAGQLQRALAVFRGEIKFAGGRLLTVSAPKEIMPAIEDAIKRLDVPSPSKNAELTAFVLMASNESNADTGVTAGLQPVVNQLRGVLAYKNFQLLDTLIARGSDQHTITLRGTLTVAGPPMPTTYTMTGLFSIDDRNDKAPLLQVKNMHFDLSVPVDIPGGGFQYQQIGVDTDVDIPRGQQIVVGKATYGAKAFILVMTAKFD